MDRRELGASVIKTHRPRPRIDRYRPKQISNRSFEEAWVMTGIENWSNELARFEILSHTFRPT